MKRMTFLALIGAFVALACGNEVVVLGDGDGGSTTTPPSTSSGHGGAGATGGTGGTGNGGAGATGGTGGMGGAGGSPLCGRTYDGFDMQLVTVNQSTFGCFSPNTQLGFHELEGAVVESYADGIVVDSCPPSADCVPLLNYLTFSAPELWNPVPPGAFVRVSVMVDQPWGCSHQLMVQNLPSWDGVPNPVIGGDMLWLAAADGVPVPMAGAGFEITPVPLGCYPNEEPGCGVEDDYALRFSGPGAETIDVLMGETWDWFVGDTYLLVRNLRSFETGWCDDYWNWGYWVSGGMLFDDF